MNEISTAGLVVVGLLAIGYWLVTRHLHRNTLTKND